jgi:amino-acid N-acetyltransferase
MTEFIISPEHNYEAVARFFIENDLEFPADEPVATDVIRCWKMTLGDEGGMIGAAALARRQGEYIVDGIAVSKDYRRGGAGKRLLDMVVAETGRLGGTRLYLVARTPDFFRNAGFVTVPRDRAPDFFECLTCPQYGIDCRPEVMELEIGTYKKTAGHFRK